MPEEKFRLPQSSYEELVKIIKAYGHINTPTAPAEVGRLAGMHETIVSANNAFLLAAGILEGGKKKVMTQRGKALATALEHELGDEIARNWREIVMGSEFLQRLVPAVKIRKGMERSTLQSHIAYSAGRPRSSRTMAGASAIVEMLGAAGLLQEEDGKLVVAASDQVPVQQDSVKVHASVTQAGQQIVTPGETSVTRGLAAAPSQGLANRQRRYSGPTEQGDFVSNRSPRGNKRHPRQSRDLQPGSDGGRGRSLSIP